jgi:anti-sigma factor RsiW
MKQKHLTCKESLAHICGEMDEHIDSPKCREIKKHLAACPSCAAYLDSLKKTIRLYREYPCPKLPGRCRQELLATLKAKALRRQTRPAKIREASSLPKKRTGGRKSGQS